MCADSSARTRLSGVCKLGRSRKMFGVFRSTTRALGRDILDCSDSDARASLGCADSGARARLSEVCDSGARARGSEVFRVGPGEIYSGLFRLGRSRKLGRWCVDSGIRARCSGVCRIRLLAQDTLRSGIWTRLLTMLGKMLSRRSRSRGKLGHSGAHARPPNGGQTRALARSRNGVHTRALAMLAQTWALAQDARGRV